MRLPCLQRSLHLAYIPCRHLSPPFPFSGLALGAGGSVTSGWGLSVSCPKGNWCTGHPVFCGPTLVTCQGPYIVWRPFWSTFEALHPKQVAGDEASMIKFCSPARGSHQLLFSLRDVGPSSQSEMSIWILNLANQICCAFPPKKGQGSSRSSQTCFIHLLSCSNGCRAYAEHKSRSLASSSICLWEDLVE